jgi:hypothetical protein
LAWITNFAGTEAGDLKLLTQHYYRGGAKDPASTLEKLLEHDDGWHSRLKDLQQICRDQNIAFRINEVNSFFGGGKPGVSDTFGAALWCLDYMFLLASYGCAGVNVETDINQLGWISHYSPSFMMRLGIAAPVRSITGCWHLRWPAKGFAKIGFEEKRYQSDRVRNNG